MNDRWATEALVLASIVVTESTEALENARKRRDHMMRLAAGNGMRASDIARAVGMSPGQVSRILNPGGRP
jgi:DNA-binding MarR family transcriptional regulator